MLSKNVHDPRMVYAKALQDRGVLVGVTYNSDGLFVLPQVTPAITPELRTPLCVEYLNASALRTAADREHANILLLNKQIGKNLDVSDYSISRAANNMAVSVLGVGCLYGIGQYAPPSVMPLQYVFGALAVVTAGMSTFWIKTHFNDRASRKDLFMAYDITEGNYRLCLNEIKRRREAAVS